MNQMQMNGQMNQMQMNGQMQMQQMNGQMNQMQMNGQMNQMQMNGQMQQMNGQGGNAQRNGLQQPVKMLPGLPGTRPVQREPLMRAQQNLAQAGQRQGGARSSSTSSTTPAELAQYLRARPGASAPLSSLVSAGSASVVQSRPDLFHVENGTVMLREARPEAAGPPPVELYAVEEAFTPTSTEHGELALQVGELVAVTQQHAAGWWRGDLVKTRGRDAGARTTGWFPGAFVDKLVGTLTPSGARGRAAIYDV